MQLVPRVAVAAPLTVSRAGQVSETTVNNFKPDLIEAGTARASSELYAPFSENSDVAITDAVVSRHKPTLNSGRIEGTLRVLSGESFGINGSTQITSDLYLPGTPAIQLSGSAQHGGTVAEGGAASPENYSLSLSGSINLPGRIHTRVDAISLPTDFPSSVPLPSGTRTVTVNSQSGVAAIGNWQTVRDLNVKGSQITINVPPGNYGTLTVNGNSQLNFTAGTYNFSNTINLDGSASLRATGAVIINVAQDLTINSGAIVLGSYTSPADLHLNILGSLVKVNGSSQVSGLLRADNATVILGGTSQVRGQVIANSLTLSGGKVIGAIWPVRSGSNLTIFGPRRFDRTTGPPNQYMEQFALPAGVTSPYTLHIQNGEANGSNRVSSATVKLNGVEILIQSDLNQNVAGFDRTVTLAANNQLDVRLTSNPGSYLIINIAGPISISDTTPPALSISTPANNFTTTDAQVSISGTAVDSGSGASGVSHVYVNDTEATYNSADGTWTLANFPLALGANQITVRAIDQTGNAAETSITVTRHAPNHEPTANAGPDQTLTLPQTASLHGTATDDGLPEGSTLTTSWTEISGPGDVTFSIAGALETIASFTAAGTYVLRLTASDGALSTSDDITITVQPPNQPPTVNAGPDQTIALPHSAILNGTATDDGLPTGSTLTTTWSKVSGPGLVTFEDAILTETNASFSEAGTYVLRLTASDAELSSQSDVTITVHPENHAPSVDAGQGQTVSLPNAAIQLNGSASDDGWPYGSTLTVSWSMLSGPGSVVFDNPNLLTTGAHFDVAGVYVLQLTATDGELSSSDGVTITVTPPNQAPTVEAGSDQQIVLPTSAGLNGTVGDDGLPLGSSVSTIWTMVSGPGVVTFANPNVTVTAASFSAAGTYVLRLTASDSQLSGADDVTVTVLPQNQAPTTNAGPDQTITLPSTASLNGSISDDGYPVGSTLTSHWSQVSGPGTVVFANASAPVTTASFSAPGSYVLRLTTTDSELSSSDELNVTVIPENLAPTVEAGADQMIALPSMANLNGSVSDDGLPMGSTLTTTWTKLSGPGDVVFASPNTTVTTASFSVPGTYVLRLTANDSDLTTSDELSVTVDPESQAPNVNAGADQTITLPATASLNGTATDDGWPRGSSVSVSWSQVSGPGTASFAAPNATATVVTFSQDGTYVLRLTASDSQLSSNDEIQLTVIPENHAPTANAGSDQTITLPAQANLNGVVSDDALPAGSTLSSVWSKVSGPGAVTFANPNVTVTTAAFSESGTYVLRLMANDSERSSGDDVQITVTPENHAPTANAGADQQVTLPNTAALNGSVNDDGLPGGSTLTSTWSKVSGPGTVTFGNPGSAVTTAAFSVAGTYLLRLTASDSELSASDDVQITVIPENHAPTVSAGADQTITLPNIVSLNGSVSDDGMPAGSSLSSSWSKVSGPGEVVFSNPSTTNTSASFCAAGTYVLRLTATDSQLSGSDELTVTVRKLHTQTFQSGNGEIGQQDAYNVASRDGGLTYHPAYVIETYQSWLIVPGTNFYWETIPGTKWINWQPNIWAAQPGNWFTSHSVTKYRLSFTLPADYSNPALFGRIAADERATVRLNGTQIGQFYTAHNPGGFLSTDDTTLFHAGENLVEFDVEDICCGTHGFDYRITVSATTAAPHGNQTPAVITGPDQTISLPNAASLNGTVADDGLPCNTPLTVLWSKVTGPGAVTFANANAPTTTATFATPGSYLLRLSASDGQLASSDDMKVLVDPPNQAPLVNAGPDQVIRHPDGASLNGSVTDDGVPSGSTVSATWSKQSGPGEVTFANSQAAATSATFTVAGVYILRLAASDSDLTVFDELTVTVNPLTTACPNDDFTDNFDDNSLNAGQWTIATPSSTVAVFERNQRLELVLQPNKVDYNGVHSLSTFDLRGKSLQVEVKEATSQVGYTETYLVAALDGSNYYLMDAGAGSFALDSYTAGVRDRTVISYQPTTHRFWRLRHVSDENKVNFETSADGSIWITRKTVPATFPLNAIRIQLMAGAWGTGNGAPGKAVFDNVRLVSLAPNCLPSVTLTSPTPNSTFSTHSNISLEANASDSDGSISKVEFYSNGAKLGEAVASPYTFVWNDVAAGTYSLSARVTDDKGATATSAPVQITVVTTNQAPIVSAGPDQSINLPAVATLNGSASDDGLPAASTLTTTWSKVSGAGTVSFANANVTITTATFSEAGVYELTLTASDSELSSTDTVTITVGMPLNPPTADFAVVGDSSVIPLTVESFSSERTGDAPAIRLVDHNVGTAWRSASGLVTNQFVKFRLPGDEPHLIDRVRLQSQFANANLAVMVKNFEILVSEKTAADADFTSVFSGTYANTGKLEEFVFSSGPAHARYIKFIAKNNYGATGYIEVATFEVSSAGSADSIISLTGQNNAALDQGPAQLSNGAEVVDYSYTYGLNIYENSANKMLEHKYDAWSASNAPNQYATIRLAGGKEYLLEGVKIGTWHDQGYGRPLALKDFEVWVSNTTTDAAAFTKVLTATALFDEPVQHFMFPGGPVLAKYVKHVPLTNHGGGNTINTLFFDVIVHGTGGVVAASGQFDAGRSAEAMLDGDVETTWLSRSGVNTNQWVKIALADDKIHKVYGVRIYPSNTPNFPPNGPKDFEVRVSTTTTDDAAFTTVYTGTLTSAAGWQEIFFSQTVDAKHVQFYWINSHGQSYLSVKEVEVLAFPDEGATLLAYSSQNSSILGPLSALDIDSVNRPWITGANQNVNQFLKLRLPRAELWTIDRVALRPGWLSSGATPLTNMSAKDFDIQISTTDADAASFSTIYSGTLTTTDLLQYFGFAPVQARYVRLLIKNNYGGTAIGLKSFYIFSRDFGGTTVRFRDKSTDSDGQIVSYLWDFGDGGTSVERDPEHSYAAPGTYTVTLTVTDDRGFQAQHQQQYRAAISPLNAAISPILADFTLTPRTIHEGQEYVYIYNQSSHRLGPFAARYVDFGDGGDPNNHYFRDSSASGQDSTYHHYQDSGTYQIKLRIGDPRFLSYSATKSLQVINLPPAVDIPAGKTVVWNESWTNVPTAITDPSSVDQASLRCNWSLGDGRTTEVANCNRTNGTMTTSYSHPGVYPATLMVTDKDGGSSADTATYIVNKRKTGLVFLEAQADDSTGTYLMRARLTDNYANVPLAGKIVVFALNGATASSTTDANGVAQTQFTFAPGTPITLGTASFFEEEFYLESGSAVTNTPGPNRPQTHTRASAGTDFWLTVPGNLNLYCNIGGCYQQRPLVKLFISAPHNTSGTVTVPGLGFTQAFSVQANTVTTVSVNDLTSLDSSDLVENKGIHVTSQAPVTVYGLSDIIFTSDAFLGLPTNALGTEYIALGYNNGTNLHGTQFAIVAAENATTVTITPSIAVGSRAARVPYTVTLNQGQTYQLRNDQLGESFDLSGTIITANKPLAVFGGHKAGNVPHTVYYANYLVEQLPPTNTWGQYFVTVPFATRLNGDTFRLLAKQDGTRVYVNGVRVATLNRGQLHEQIIAGSAYIVADQPILVAQYANGNTFDQQNGDPTMMLVPPYEQFGNSYTVTTSASRFNVNYLNVVAPTSSVGAVMLDGTAIPPASFTPIGNSGFSGAQITISLGTHNLSGPEPFGTFVYGFAITDGYSYPGGMNLTPIVRSVKVTLAPATATPTVGTEDCTTATVTDQNDYPLGGKQVAFSVTGVNPTTQSLTTNASGLARFCYTGANTGGDVIVATVDNATASAARDWGGNGSNQAPVVNAGANQTITLPAPANLVGSASDDGLPTNTLHVSWAKVSGPGNVTFGNSSATATTAAFDVAGVYVLRLSATDTQLSSSDDLQITVSPASGNQPPTANAGPDQTVQLNANLISNGGNEDLLMSGEIPGWTEVQGTSWTAGSMNIAGFPEAQRGNAYFYSGSAAQAELRQDIDLSAYAAGIAAGTQQFELKVYLRSAAEALPDAGRVLVEYRNVTNTSVIATLSSGDITSTTVWHLTEDTRAVPPGTGWIRLRLIATHNANAASDASNDAFFDSVSFRPIGAAAVKLNGVITDDGLPSGSSLAANWNLVSGPGAMTFANPNAAVSGATFTTPGTYVLRLTATDGQANTTDDVTIIVNPANQPPVVSAGANQTITLPATAALNGSATDDGQPSGSSVSVSWGKVSGPGVVTFGNANQAATTASFSAAGTYVLRLTADDTEYDASAEIAITVNPGVTPVNQPPSVNPGPNQTIALPADTVTLNGTGTDDGLPAGSTLTVTWTKISGPGTVTFGNANSAVTTAQFSAVGSYVLRLSASDGAYLASADVGVILTPENQSPTANAGVDQTTILSAGAQLNGSVSDDGLPVGGNLTTTWSKVSGPGTVTFMNANVTVTGATFSATGTYVLRLTASDSALSASDDLTIIVNDDVAPPTVAITAPADDASVTEPTTVTGSVSGGAWTLEYSLGSDDNPNNRVWTQFANGNGATSGTLGTLDPTMMLNGLFDIRLSATDQYGQMSRTKVSVVVEKNLKVGNFTVSFTDLSIPVAGVPMEVTRTYDSRDKRVGDFGFGWTMGLRNIRVEKAGVLGLKWYETVSQEVFPNYCLEPVGSHAVTVTFPGGKVFKFQPAVTPHCQRNAPITSANISFMPMPGTVGKLEVVGSTDVQIDGSVPGPVNLIGFGGGVDIFNSFVFKFTAEDGTSYIIDQRTGLQSLSDLNGNTLTIGAGGIVHSNGKSIVFNRDGLGRISSIVDPNGNSQTYAYDANGDLVSYTDNENNTSTYTYDTNHRLLTIQDPRGIQPIRNDYDPDGRLISHTDGFGKVITYIHDIPNRTETITDRLGHPTVFEYDERGNVLKKTDARGGVTSFTYDAYDNVLTETNALGKTTTYTYDANDHPTSITDPLNKVTQFTYNALGRVLTTTDPLGHITTNTYDSAGRLKTTEDPLHNVTSLIYSVFDGQMTSRTDALNHITRYEYTGSYLTKQTDALGHETTFTYDNNGNRAGQTVIRTNALGQLETLTTSYEYDKLNRPTKTTFADGSFTRVEYNSIGQRSATIDQLSRRTEFTYDDMGRLIKTTYADGTFEETTYDAEGRRLTSKDRAGRETTYTYDELGRLTKTTFIDGTFTQTTYDAAGQVLTTTDARNNVTRYFYDDAGRRTKVRNALNQETTLTYDDIGNQLTITDALSHTTTYEYDLNNRRTKTIYHDGTFDSVVYDEVGRSVSKTDQANKTTQFTYDSMGRLTKVKDALNQETTYGYDEIGQQISQTDANNHTTRFEYDKLGRRAKRILPGGQFETYTYDNGGNLQNKTDFNGKTTAFAYDTMRRLLSKTPDASLSQPTVSFTYNANGRRATMNDGSGATVYNYDVRNRLTSKQTPFGTLSYAYNEAGSLLTTRSSNANGLSVDYSYDSLNRLATVKDNKILAVNGGVTNYTYDTVGNLQSYQYPNGVTTSYAFNSQNRLTTMTVGTPASSLASYSYTLGAAGNRTAVTELGGRTVTYTYDDLYRLTSESIANDPHGVNGNISYSYDLVGNRLSRTSTVAGVPSQNSTFDANDRLTSNNYDNNGNTTNANGSTYVYDFENHLTNLNSGNVTYAYDGDGNRVAKTVGGVTTNYLVDTNNPTGYAQVVDELQGAAVVKSFTYGQDRISQRIVGGSFSFYQYDGHGSVRQLTDATATITDTYDYDAFGNLIYRSGTTPNDYLYSGEQFDAQLGFYYLRARYMNSSSGRFWTSDTYEGDRVDPRSLHKYLYANGDPVNRIDPSGQFSIGEAVQVATISTIIANIAILGFSFASAASHNFEVDGALISLRGNFSSHGFTGGAGIDVIYQFSTRQWFYAGTGELGTNPLSLFGKHRGFGYSASIGAIVGMRDPSEMAGAAATAVIPRSAARLLAGVLYKENTAWGAMTQLAKRSLNPSWGDMAFGVGLSSSGPSFATIGFRSNLFASLISFTSSYRPVDTIGDDLRDAIGPLHGLVEGGALKSGDTIGANADAIINALTSFN